MTRGFVAISQAVAPSTCYADCEIKSSAPVCVATVLWSSIYPELQILGISQPQTLWVTQNPLQL